MTIRQTLSAVPEGTPGADGAFWRANREGAEISVFRNAMPAGRITLGSEFGISGIEAEARIPALAAALEALFAEAPELKEVAISAGTISATEARQLGCATVTAEGMAVRRAGFFQSAPLWLAHPPASRQDATHLPGPEGRDHPLRAPKPEGLCYQRYDQVSGVMVSLRALEISRDLDRFHRWMNDGRVAWFWELAKPKEELAEYLRALEADPHSYPLILSFDGEEAGYLETYWVRENRLGPYYKSEPWDRGWHALVGEHAHLGRRKTAAWLRAIGHYLFLDCPMTEKLMGEPRADNVKLLRYADQMSYEKVKEFDFPHKRAALMRCPRARFFAEQL